MDAGNDISPEMALNYLQWLEAMGADEAVDEAPQDRFVAQTKPEMASATPRTDIQARKQAPITAQPMGPATPLNDRSADAEAAIQAAKQTAAACQNLDDLIAALEKFEACPLSRTASKLAFIDGSLSPDILILGDKPAREDDREGKPFAGPEGILLDRMLAAIGMSRETTMLSNLVFWYPPGNRNPTEPELAMCEPFLEKLVQLHRPRFILSFGTIASQRLLQETTGIIKLRGRWGVWQDIPTLATWHPRELLTTPLLKADAWKDLQALREKLHA